MTGNGAAQPISAIAGYHAHVYFDAPERERAARLRDGIAARFRVRIGSWHDRAVGPHSKPMYQVAFAVEEFSRLVPWLMLNRDGLSILVHPNTLRPRDDHLVHALWLGAPLPLNDGPLELQLNSAAEIEQTPPPNTEPHLAP